MKTRSWKTMGGKKRTSGEAVGRKEMWVESEQSEKRSFSISKAASPFTIQQSQSRFNPCTALWESYSVSMDETSLLLLLLLPQWPLRCCCSPLIQRGIFLSDSICSRCSRRNIFWSVQVWRWQTAGRQVLELDAARLQVRRQYEL